MRHQMEDFEQDMLALVRASYALLQAHRKGEPTGSLWIELQCAVDQVEPWFDNETPAQMGWARFDGRP